jgi:hypothetical protein
VNPVLVVIAYIVPKQTQKMTLVQSNDMIQELTAAASYPTFGSSLICFAKRLLRVYSRFSNDCGALACCER